jgi:hypothetical protein
LDSPAHSTLAAVVVRISVRDPLPPERPGPLGLPPGFHSPPGFHPLGIVVLNPARTRRACFSEVPDCPSLPVRAAFYDIRERLTVPPIPPFDNRN